MSATLSEEDSKRLLAPFGIPLVAGEVAHSAVAASGAAARLGFPVVAKLCGERIAHKTERGLVRLNLTDEDAVAVAAAELFAAARPEDGDVGVLLAPMVRGNRELIAGVSTDPQFGATVMVGVGGVLAEALGDVSVRLVPIEEIDAFEMLDDLRSQALLGPLRGEPAVDRAAVVAVLMALSKAAQAHPEIVSIDLNPLIIVGGLPVAVDALVELEDRA
ncbi:MAG: acetate--CoA ligase family protein [Microthrixaceae bacterium]|nr:acetate--CoA ligase family protein [Microthrixaceae bacterium]